MNLLTRFSLASAAGLLLATSCVNTERESSAPSTSSSTYTPPSGQGQRVSSTTVLNTVRTTHTFSSAQAPDNFVLQLRGPRILSGRLFFSVVNSAGDTVRQEIIPARVLQDPTASTTRDQEISVLRGMNNFFTPTHFTTPAIPASARQPAEVDTQAWTTVQADPAAVGFDHLTADGSMARLVYSAKLGRAVVLPQ